MKNPYRIINRAVKDAKAKGYQIVANTWGLTTKRGRFQCENNCMCPLGAVLRGKKPTKSKELGAAASRVLSVPRGWIVAFYHGVDGKHYNYNPEFNDAYSFGRELRENAMSFPQ